MAVKRYDGSAWQVVAGKGDQGTSSSISTWVKTASGGETSLSGNDDNSQSLSYTVGQELVFINGTLLKRGSDYTATNGTSITGLTALAANDVATVWTVNAFSVTNAISSGLVTTTGDMIYASGANTPARLGIGSTDQVLKVSGGVPVWGAAPSPSFVGAWATRGSGTISITNNVAFQIPFDSEVVDTNGFHDNSTNNSRFTIPSGYGGKYLLIGYGSLSAGSSDGFTLRYYLNGSGSGDQNILQQHRNLGGNNAAILGSRIVSLSAGDYVELYMVYNATATPTVVAAFYLYYLGA
jgi:hypothetical protein